MLATAKASDDLIYTLYFEGTDFETNAREANNHNSNYVIEFAWNGRRQNQRLEF